MIIARVPIYRVAMSRDELKLIHEALDEYEDRCHVYADSENDGSREREEFLDKAYEAHALAETVKAALLKS